MILGFPVLRLRGDYLAIVTLAFGEIIRLVLINWTDVTGGGAGISSIPRATFFGIPFTAGDDGFAATFGIQPKEQQHMVQAISDAVADVGPQVRQAMAQHPGFEDIGKRMLMAWAEGVQGLRDQRVYAVGEWTSGDAFEGFSPPPKIKADLSRIGRSPLMGKR